MINMEKEYCADGNIRIRKKDWGSFTVKELKEALNMLGDECSNLCICCADDADFVWDIKYNEKNHSLTFE